MITDQECCFCTTLRSLSDKQTFTQFMERLHAMMCDFQCASCNFSAAAHLLRHPHPRKLRQDIVCEAFDRKEP